MNKYESKSRLFVNIKERAKDIYNFFHHEIVFYDKMNILDNLLISPDYHDILSYPKQFFKKIQVFLTQRIFYRSCFVVST